MEMMENFTEEDWQKLLNDIETKSNLWKERLAYILSNKTNPCKSILKTYLFESESREKLTRCKDYILYIKNNLGTEVSHEILMEKADDQIQTQNLTTEKN